MRVESLGYIQRNLPRLPPRAREVTDDLNLIIQRDRRLSVVFEWEKYTINMQIYCVIYCKSTQWRILREQFAC